MITLKFEARNVYGRRLYYAACTKSQAIVDLMGRKCFRSNDIERLKYSGFKVDITELKTQEGVRK